MEFLEFDFLKAEAQVVRLEELSNQIHQLASAQYNEAIQELSGSWQGTAADTFMKKAGKLYEKLEQTSRDLDKTAKGLKQAAKRARTAELMAKGIVGRSN